MEPESNINDEAIAECRERTLELLVRLGNAIKGGLRKELRCAFTPAFCRTLTIDQHNYIRDAYDGDPLGSDFEHQVQSAVLDTARTLLSLRASILERHTPRMEDGQPIYFPPDFPVGDDLRLPDALLEWGVDFLASRLTGSHRPEVRGLAADYAWLQVIAWDCLRQVPRLVRDLNRQAVRTLVGTILSVKNYGGDWGEEPRTPLEGRRMEST